MSCVLRLIDVSTTPGCRLYAVTPSGDKRRFNSAAKRTFANFDKPYADSAELIPLSCVGENFSHVTCCGVRLRTILQMNEDTLAGA